MSDYGDEDLSDYGEDWFYVEDTFMVADDLAEHTVNSPPPTTYADEDAIPDWDRFDYYNDLEYASDGYNDDNFYIHGSRTAKTGQKRKRRGGDRHGKKNQKLEGGQRVTSRTESPTPGWPPVVWRSQAEREKKPKQFEDIQEPFALLRDWKERLDHTPTWLSEHSDSTKLKASKAAKGKGVPIAKPVSPSPEPENKEEGGGDIDSAVLMAALQNRLSSTGGPLTGLDPSQLLQYLTRMMNDKDASDDIAGQLADDMLNQGGEDDEDDDEAPADLLSWISQQRDTNEVGPIYVQDSVAPSVTPKSPNFGSSSKRPPTPLSSQTNRSNDGAFKQNNATGEVVQGSSFRKRKVHEDDIEVGTTAPRTKRAARSYDAPKAASQAPVSSTTVKATRSGRTKRS
ncbi:hypothetical protein K469DRAFT_580611 [Zopfia rhizophila CBS 207.26]|uniref:Uncharacterized protein n=1 Tax=Zopfia rhizophila CBS 207.26 TaxID=1314779 RepID=A0A6A6DWM4_9PEZI|nr:hypothetical protein K469DRAFT_580611 [Zopfia rhizophila CBS 207.26]